MPGVARLLLSEFEFECSIQSAIVVLSGAHKLEV